MTRLRRRARQFLSFAAIGAAGFLVSVTTLAIVAPLIGSLPAWAPAFLAAVTFTYALNRRFTFRRAADDVSWITGWMRFLIANALGAAVNFAVYGALIVAALPTISAPPAALAFGSAAGLAVNFTLSAAFVFRPETVRK